MSGNRVKLHRRNKSSIGRPAKAWLTAATVLAAVGWSMGVRAESPADVVTAAMAPIKKFDFGAPFTPPGGKKVTFITCGSLGIGCVVAANAAKDASAVLGWDMKIVDGKVDPGVWNTAIQQAVSDHADGVLMAAVSPALTQGGLEKAKAARIPVFNIYAPKFPGEPTIDGYITSDHGQGGVIIADWITVDSGGKANVLILDTVQFPEIVQRNDAIIKELARACPSCTVTRQAFSPPEAPQRLAGLVSAQLQQNPKINYVSGPYDAAATFIAQGIRQAQKTSNVKFVSAEGSPSGYQLIKDGDMAADLAISNQFPGWLAVDTLARKLANSQYPEEQLLPQRLFTNKEELPTSQLGWDMDFDYRAAFKKLWSK